MVGVSSQSTRFHFGEYLGEYPPNFHHSRPGKNGPSGEISLGVLANFGTIISMAMENPPIFNR